MLVIFYKTVRIILLFWWLKIMLINRRRLPAAVVVRVARSQGHFLSAWYRTENRFFMPVAQCCLFDPFKSQETVLFPKHMYCIIHVKSCVMCLVCAPTCIVNSDFRIGSLKATKKIFHIIYMFWGAVATCYQQSTYESLRSHWNASTTTGWTAMKFPSSICGFSIFLRLMKYGNISFHTNYSTV